MKKPEKAIGNISKELIKSLNIAENEKDVENSYREAFGKYYPSSISSANKTDGLLICDDVTALMEFKFKNNLRGKLEAAAVILQILFYLKKMEKLGKVLPKSIFIGNKSQCFCINIVPPIAKYLVTNGIDWSVAASKSPAVYPDLVKKIAGDEEINPFIYDVDEKFDFSEVIERMKSLEKGTGYAIAITNENVIEIFNYFTAHVITDSKYDNNTLFKDDNHKAAIRLSDIFLGCLTDRDTTYLHPKKKNVLVARGEEVRVDANLYKSFFGHFKQEYTPKELEVVVSNRDRIFEEIYRRRTGAFFTPPIWVAESQKMISEALGEDWREEWVVWDCACGVGNLTRDNNFKELYLSTLDSGDVNTIKDMGFNRGATIFQYDFLNEIGIDGVPEKLKKAIADGKKVLIYINPPYGTSKNGSTKDEDSKTGIAKNKVNDEMLNQKMGFSARQLYCQFLFKLSTLAKNKNKKLNISIGIFCPPVFVSGPSYEKFNVLFKSVFNYSRGMIFQASNFADVSDDWSIGFTLWKNIPEDTQEKIVVDVKEIRENFSVTSVGTKEIYSANNKLASEWVREEIKNLEKIDAPQLTSAVVTKAEGIGRMVKNGLGFLHCSGNSVYYNMQFVGLLSSPFASPAGVPFNDSNFMKVAALFTARRSVERTWVNWQDEYMVPDTSHKDYEKWNNDAIVYSLFNAKSNQSSLRDIKYKGKKWDIVNNFFFMSNKEMAELANDNNFNEMYQDTKQFPGERYVYTLLKNTNLSDDAKEVLEMAREMVRKTFEMRVKFSEEHTEYHLQSWDSGWSQIKPMMKQYFKADYDKFVEKYKAFESRMREGVYTFGFLNR